MDAAPRNTALACEADATRATLIARIRDWNDDQGWQDFFQTYWRLIYALAIRQGLSDSEAEEIVQCTVIAVAKNIRDFDYDPQQGSFRNWLIHQAMWRIADFQRTRQREREIFVRPSREKTSPGTGTSERIPDPVDGHVASWEGEWREGAHAAALSVLRAKVPPKHYQVFDLYVLREWTPDRVCRTLGLRRPMMYLIASRVKHSYQQEVLRIERTLSHVPAPKPQRS